MADGSIIRALLRDRRGAYSIMTALLLPVLAGFTALGTETGVWFYRHQSMQGAADAAAFSAAIAYGTGNTTGYQADANAVAARYGFVNGTGGAVVAVHRPPSSGPNAGNPGAVEVTISQTQVRLFSAALTSTPLSIAARAVAAPNGSGVACVLGLDPTAAATVSILNNAVMPDPTCGVVSNSSSSTGVSLNNNAHVYGPVTSHGGIYVANNAGLHGSPNLQNAAAVPDPYASANPGAPPACTSQNGAGSNNGTRTLRPDVTVGGVGMAHFCSGLNFTNNFTVTMQPGIYFIDSQMVFGNNASITGSGVTLVINGNYAINLGNNAHITLSAPTTGPTAGIIMFGGRTATSTVTHTFANNTVLNFTGAVYFPNQIVHFDNNGTTNPTGGCTQVIGRRVILMNNVNLRSNCAGTGVATISTGGGIIALVE